MDVSAASRPLMKLGLVCLKEGREKAKGRMIDEHMCYVIASQQGSVSAWQPSGRRVSIRRMGRQDWQR